MKRILILLMIAAISFSGCSIYKKYIDTRIIESDNRDIIDSEVVEKEIVLYFAGSQGMHVTPEKRIIKVDKDIDSADFAKIVLEELIKGPKTEKLYKTIPEEVKVLNVEINGDVIHIDFSREMHTKHCGGGAGEDMTISSLVYTMTELDGIKKVLPSVEGTILNIDHIIVDEPLERMADKIDK